MGSSLSSGVKTTEEKVEKNESPPIPFSSLPNDVVVNILSRISKTHRPTLSLVSKFLRSIVLSLELDEATGKSENRLYVSVNLNYNPNSRWLLLSPIPKPISSFPLQTSKSSTILSYGSKIYIIGGYIKGKRSRRVLILDCRCHQWLTLPKLRLPRVNPAAAVIDGKIYVIGGSSMSIKSEDWGEVYDPKTRIWEPFSPMTLDLTFQMSLLPGRLVIGGKVYSMNGLSLCLEKGICLVETEEKELCQTSIFEGDLLWCDLKEESFGWRKVKGLEELNHNPNYPNHFTYVENSSAGGGGRRVTLWWKTVVIRCKDHDWIKEYKTEIWCAEVWFKRHSQEELWGFVKWSKNVFSFDGYDSESDFFLHSAIVTH